MKDPNKLCLGCMNEWGNPKKPCPVCGFVAADYEKPPRWLPLKNILNGKYMIGKVIGEGGFGITYVGWDLNLQVRVAIKEYFPVGLATRETGNGRSNSISALPGVRQENYKQGLEKFMTEAKNLSKFYNLQGIVAVKEFFFENDTAYMVMEFVDGITLSTYLKKHGGQITEQEALQLFHPVIESLKVVHQSGIIHRDISPDNIMMTKDGRMKLIDFGAARFAGGDTERSLTIILKHGYAPAEQYQSHGNQGPWTDVYAICATMYRMITGKVPPSAMDRLHEDTLEEFSSLGCNVSKKTAYAVIDKGLAIKVEDRYRNMDELLQGLYGLDNKKVRRKKKAPKYNLPVIGGIAAACLIVLIAGIFLLSGNSSKQTSVKTDTENESPGIMNAIESSISKKKDPAPASAEELSRLQSEAIKAEERIASGAHHLVSLREDGTVAASGTNYYGNLDVEKWNQIQSISTGSYHTVGVKEDGSVVAAGDTSNGKCAVDTWKDIAKTAVGDEHTLGVKSDGSVVAAGSNESGQCNVSSWNGITDIAAGEAHSLGLKEDGTVTAAGDDSYGQCQTDGWNQVVKVYAKGNLSAGLKADGTVVLSGDTTGLEDALEWKQVISLSLGENYIAGLLSDKSVVTAGSIAVSQDKVNSWENIDAIAASDEILFGRKSDGSIVRTTYNYGTASKDELNNLQKVVSGGGYLAGLKSDGTVQIWGVSGTDFGQSQADSWTDIRDIAACPEAILGVRSDGSVAVAGRGYEEVSGWTGIEKIVVTEGLAVGLKSDGTLIASGEAASGTDFSNWTDIRELCAGFNGEIAAIRNDGSVIGSNLDMSTVSSAVSIDAGAEHIAAALDDGTVTVKGRSSSGYANVYSWRDVTQVAVGAEHTIGLKSDGTVLAAGSNSNGQCNISDWTDVVYVSAGEYYTLGLKSDGTLLIAGKIPGEF